MLSNAKPVKIQHVIKYNYLNKITRWFFFFILGSLFLSRIKIFLLIKILLTHILYAYIEAFSTI